MKMINAEKIISVTQYLPKADSSDEPYLLGREAARSCSEALVGELLERGYSRNAIIDGLASALSSVVTKTFAPRN